MEKVLQELFRVDFFGVPIPFRQYQNTFGCGTASIKNLFAHHFDAFQKHNTNSLEFGDSLLH